MRLARPVGAVRQVGARGDRCTDGRPVAASPRASRPSGGDVRQWNCGTIR
ncbi:hypothetical protein Cus16_0892 [Curtobacterium sp. ER1/6]|nr:hypothetical protein Cus16_0892 [Curtobacterium sp. ER1/6]